MKRERGKNNFIAEGERKRKAWDEIKQLKNNIIIVTLCLAIGFLPDSRVLKSISRYTETRAQRQGRK